MLRNPDFKGHQSAMNLANRAETLGVSDCKACGHAIAWATSKRTGKRYPCEVTWKQSEEYGFNADVLRAAPWELHTAERCQANQDRSAREREERLQQDEADEALRDFNAMTRCVDRARGRYFRVAA